ncbi:hypothetical protein LGM54_30545 [Burkholderia cenocepacia]|uniref:hypothetical protein n=1 Tax=Burkholderia cenocepacia TaxID=95486 RepID=UPI001CF0F130|nr:hypothetical protein [Burkholderia cenocepacia]MCA7967325.1 hypothetical protein [Burkholderia cenocepacia]
MTDEFPLQLLQAISDWQRGGDAKQNKRRGQKLKEVCVSLPEKYRTCSLCCFRQIALPEGGVWNLIGEDRLPEKISSWTLDLEVAKTIKRGVPAEGQGYQGVILCVLPPADSVIVNLHELYQDSDFTAALEQHKGSITGYYGGAGRYGNDQSEIVLEVASVAQQDIYSMGGHSSPFEQLVDEAAKIIHGRPATPEEREALMLKVEHVASEAGPRWLSLEATQRVLTRMEPRVEVLREIRLQQDAAK